MVTIMTGDCREVLKTLPDASVNCCVTSPPYWGLRDYGVVGQIGLERTIDEYLAKMVEVFREVRRVLRSDGTCWLNLGDSYNAYNGNRCTESSYAGDRVVMEPEFPSGHGLQARALKQKDLIGIPWRVAFALQADGWYLRMDIIWHKPNPMPESVTDRPTKAHEYIFLLSKSVRYYYDAAAIKEPASGGTHPRSAAAGEYPGNAERDDNRRRMKTPDGWDTSKGAGGHGSFHKEGREKGEMVGTGVGWGRLSENDPGDNRAGRGRQRKVEGPGSAMHVSRMAGREDSKPYPSKSALRDPDGDKIHGNIPGRSDGGAACNDPSQLFRNKRSVWTVTTQPFKDAHFATFPPKLVIPYILAGCPERGNVLDPFAGSGTVGEVAEGLGRNSVLIEMKPEYVEMAKRRTAQGGLFCGVAPDNQCGE